jgi:hypothetical protein
MIELTFDEAEKYTRFLDNYLFDLRLEIVETEAHDLRNTLRRCSLKNF